MILGEKGVAVRRQLRRAKKDSRNINVRAAFIHVIGDLIQSIGVVIAGYVVWFGKHYAVRHMASKVCMNREHAPRLLQ